jgi:hypothetical protein
MCPQCTLRINVSEAPAGRGYVCRACDFQFGDPHEKKRLPKRETTRGRSSRQEKFNARSVGGRLTANSGAGKDKGDVKIRGLLREEDKTTTKDSFVLRRADLRKIAAAAQGDEIPIMRIAFEDNLREQFVVLPSDWFEQLLTNYRENQ